MFFLSQMLKTPYFCGGEKSLNFEKNHSLTNGCKVLSISELALSFEIDICVI